MSKKQVLLDLANKLERAKKGSRQLDAEITTACRMFPEEFPWVDDFPNWQPAEGGRVNVLHDDGTLAVHFIAKQYTTGPEMDLQKAYSLLPNNWQLYTLLRQEMSSEKKGWFCGLDRIGQGSVLVYHTNPKLALVTACLQARKMELTLKE